MIYIQSIVSARRELSNGNEFHLLSILDLEPMRMASLKYIYESANFPDNDKLLRDANSAADRLYRRLETLDVGGLAISDYGKKYLGNQLGDIGGTLQRYAYILAWSVAYQETPKEEFVFVDYGGGPGILSLLAKELGIGTVIYNDVYDVSCRDSKVVGEKVGNESDFYVEGDVDDLISFLRKNSITCDAIASYDVIEHIYDVEDFMNKICSLSPKIYNIVMSSGANPYNPVIRRRILRKHFEVEYKDREKQWGYKERDCLKAYLAVRKEIISNYANNLSQAELDSLAEETRGLIESDIIECVEKYLKTGKNPPKPAHPSNTCDPYTGNWAEHIMDVSYLAGILSQRGFVVDIKAGYYPQTSKDFRKRFLTHLLNPLISVLNSKGLMLAPFYTIYGRKDSP